MFLLSNLAPHKLSVLLGTFLISFAVLAFEITTIRTLNFIVGSQFVYYALAIAMLGLSVAGSVLSCLAFEKWRAPREFLLGSLCIVISISFIVTHFLAVDIKQALVGSISDAGNTGGFYRILQVLAVEGLFAGAKLGAFLSVPYFMFGLLLGYLFATSNNSDFPSLYAFDLFGAALGAVCAILVMEFASYAVSVTFPAAVAALAAAAYLIPFNRRLCSFGVIFAALMSSVSLTSWYTDHIEPPSDPNYLTRDYDYKLNVREAWHGWNSFTRVGSIETTDDERDYAILSLANGDGMAWLLPYVPDRHPPRQHRAVVPALLLDKPPDDALVLFAGAGADLMSLHEHGAKRVTGLEINRLVVEGGLVQEKYALRDFLRNDSVNLEITEGRVFLERDKQRYDLIVYSWSGAPVVYYAGGAGDSTAYLFTHEAYEAVFDHLKPAGYAMIHGTNKVRVLASIRLYLGGRGILDAANTSIILYEPNARNKNWDAPWDGNKLLFKPSGWSQPEIDQIIKNAHEAGFLVAYAPGVETNPDYIVYERLLKTTDVQAELDRLGALKDMDFDIVTDDKPFHQSILGNGMYTSSNFWLSVLGLGDLEHKNESRSIKSLKESHVLRITFLMLFSIIAIIVTFAPLVLKGNVKRIVRKQSFHIYFLSLGAGFMLFEIILMQKASLLFGNPGMAIAIVLGSMIFFTGIGSLVSSHTFHRGLTLRSTSLCICCYLIILAIFLDSIFSHSLAWPMIAKVILLVSIAAPAAFLMGHLFPQGLSIAARADKALVPWAWGVNGATSAIAAGATPFLAQAVGFKAVLLLVVIIYGLVAFVSAPRLQQQIM